MLLSKVAEYVEKILILCDTTKSEITQTSLYNNTLIFMFKIGL